MKMEEDTNTSNIHKVTQMLDKRHKERQAHLENLHERQMKENDSAEDINYFLDSFNERARDISQNLVNIESADKSVTMAVRFDRITRSIQELQGYLSSSTLFLPDSIVKRHQRTLVDLFNKLEEMKSRLMPKKKFGFRAKPQVTPQVPSALYDDLTNINKLTATNLKANKSISNTITPSAAVEWTIHSKSDEIILLENDAVNGKDLTMSSLTNCLIQIIGHPGSLQLSNVKNCLVISGPVARSVFADNCVNSTLVFGCQQFRFHISHDCYIYMQVTCRGIIEDCTKIAFAPYTYTYDGIDVDFLKAGLDSSKNNWTDVADFNWLSTDKVSPNWRKLPELERVHDWNEAIENFKETMYKPVK